nr:MAG TPA: protein of unknown function (DUF4352) [Caudoviricetes sp.]
MDKMTTCKVCGASIAKSASTCPQCGAKQKKRHPVLGIIIAIFGICLIAAALNGMGNDSGPESQTFGVGETAELNGISVKFDSCTESNGSQFNTPDDGNVFLLCEFSIDNQSDKDIAVSSIASFNAYVDDYSTNLSISATIATDKTQLDGAIAAGKKMTGVVGYEVPKDWKEIEIRFTPDFWSGNEITFIANK